MTTTRNQCSTRSNAPFFKWVKPTVEQKAMQETWCLSTATDDWNWTKHSQ